MDKQRSLIPSLAIITVLACNGEDPLSSSAGASATLTAGASVSSAGTEAESSSSGAPADSSGGGSSGSSGDDGSTSSSTSAGVGDPSSGGDEPTTTTTGAPDPGEGTSSGEPSGTSSGTTDADDTSTGEATEGRLLPPGTPTDPDLLVAMVGDQGSGSDTKAVYKLIKDEGADLLIIAGDFDYGDDPDDWSTEMEGALGPDFPVFAAVGNHDVQAWSGYQKKLQARFAKIAGATCSGDDLGVKSSCNYRGLHFILSGLGTKGSDKDHEAFIEESLAADESLWSLCVWHKNMRDLQAGDKPDEITWKALQHCQDGGAIVVMAHEHSYARTRTLTDVGNKKAGHGAMGEPDMLEVGPGRTFSVVSGLGGKNIRGYDKGIHGDDTWWGTLYTSDYYLQNGDEVDKFAADHGAFFIRFHVDGDPSKAKGYFKNIQGDVIDEFEIVRK